MTTFARAAAACQHLRVLHPAKVLFAIVLSCGVSANVNARGPRAEPVDTAVVADTTRPRVLFTAPPTALATATSAMSTLPANAAISAIFSEDMAPATLNAASFTVSCLEPCVAPAGIVSYDHGSRTAFFIPAAPLAEGAIYTATLTAAARDLAGNALAGNVETWSAASHYVWTFAATPARPAATIAVVSTNPPAAATGVCPAAAIHATFAVPAGFSIDPRTVNAANFVLTGPAPARTAIAASSIGVDAATGRIATFTPAHALMPGATYTATLKRALTDLAVPPNAMRRDVSWTFTAGASRGACNDGVALGAAKSFGTLGGASKSSGPLTLVHGDVGSSAHAVVSGLHDASAGCTDAASQLDGVNVNGKIYTAQAARACAGKGGVAAQRIAIQGRADALAAYWALAAKPPGPDPGDGNLANRVLKPGVYTAANGSFRIQGGNLTLDGGGDTNAVWIFQMADSLTVGGPGAAYPQSVILVNGAQHKNVFWQVGGNAMINAAGGGTMVGTIISHGGATFSTPGNATKLTLNGRVMSLGAAVTMANTVINVPAP